MMSYARRESGGRVPCTYPFDMSSPNIKKRKTWDAGNMCAAVAAVRKINEDLQEKENKSGDSLFPLAAEINPVPTIQNNKTADQISRQGAAVLVTRSPHKNKVMDDRARKEANEKKKREKTICITK
uniref:Uncharacterized protein n=1 Tax=Timema bartmani TaxID=61472 RepID=A0A7R9I0T3_9NEOP|nr:unnamed protein product [Timema bartmani]